jgi:Alpha-tubulin suppressor and related RCC1 domain-containing proteins
VHTFLVTTSLGGFEDSRACRADVWRVVDESGIVSVRTSTLGTDLLRHNNNGGVKCWGRITLGSGGRHHGDRNYPVDVLNPDGTPLTGVETLVVGTGSACVLTTDKDVKCWGHNHVGQLGDGTTTNRGYATDTIGLPNGIASLNAGWSHMCVTVSDGTVNCWGRNLEKQLGDGSSTYRTSPVYTKGTGPQGFPATVDVTVSDDTASTTRSVRLMAAAG